jgi:heme-degrading monooxygenase HmoA
MIHIITERSLIHGEVSDVVRLFSEETRRARSAAGCLSAEILQSTKDHQVWLSCSTWSSSDNWQLWKASQSYNEIESEIKSQLPLSEKESVFTCIR